MLKTTTIDYELKSGEARKAVILGVSEQDSIKFLQKISKNNVARINNIGFDMTIHGITDEALDYISKKSNIQNREEASKNVESKETEVESLYKCPWCDKTFEKASTLKAHMNRTHNVKEVKEAQGE